jgi:MYXO-CTERM domain-containing protein
MGCSTGGNGASGGLSTFAAVALLGLVVRRRRAR